ncbi:MAG: hypothetical protein KDA60_19935 [Planctomycetales bacterium]|nr:hypothetical protein [Planctomycetales bacterium]
MTGIAEFRAVTESRPHVLLLCDSQGDGRWSFSIESFGGHDHQDVSDREPLVAGERLEILTVVRALESLDQPSVVTLVTPSRYVTRGIMDSLAEWRRNDWQWERFGEIVPINNADLWQRLDRTMQYHDIRCRYFRVDSAHQNRQKTVVIDDHGERVARREPRPPHFIRRRRGATAASA